MENNKVKKIMDEIRQNEKKSERAKRDLQNRCPHNDPHKSAGVLHPIADKNDPNVIKALKCEICHKKDISIDPPKPDKLKEAMDVVETAMTYAKIKLDTTVPAENELCEEIGKFLNSGDQLFKVYSNMFNDTLNKKKKKNNDRRRDGAERFYMNLH